jgi:hypothetical protein
MKFYIVTVGALSFRDLQPSSIDAILHAMDRFPGASRISARLAK